MPTVFYSWQSDLPNNTNRGFIRQVLDSAVRNINDTQSRALAVEERVEVDQDTQEVPGSPDVVQTILDKIDACDVFVPDLSIVATGGEGRPCPNPNVMLEYGYALKSISWRRIVPVMNTHYGDWSGLPFDISKRRHGASYDLARDSTPDVRADAKASLIKDLQRRIEVVLRLQRNVSREPAFERAQGFDHGAAFFDPNRGVALNVGGQSPTRFVSRPGSTIYLRLIPSHATTPLSRHDCMKAITDGDLWRFAGDSYPSWGLSVNEFGACRFARSPKEPLVIGAVSQLFLSREIWGFESFLFKDFVGRLRIVPFDFIRETLTNALRGYLKFAVDRLELKGPFSVVTGVTVVNERPIVAKTMTTGLVIDRVVSSELTVEDVNQPTDVILKPFFVRLFDAAAATMPNQ